MKMKKFINTPENLVSELLSGFAMANADKVVVEDGLVCRKSSKSADKVAVVTLGGCGHEPALSGFVGKGMLDISVPGEIFAAPGPPKLLAALRKAKRDAGTLLITLNHAGDVMSANMAKQMAEKESIKVSEVLTCEDISTGPREKPEERRGLAGCLLVCKIAGAAAEAGENLEEVTRIAQKVADNMATLAVAATSATHPSTGQVIAEVPEEDVIIGMGQHGEAGSGQMPLPTAKETVAFMLPALLEDLSIAKGEKVMVMINGVGSTTLMEQYIVLNDCKNMLTEKGIEMARSAAGEFLTVQEMGGFQMIVCRMDDELLKYYDMPASSPAFTIE
ncbi:MAG: dihydroxyacetone kinase subunit DhaK [Phycisphaerae bacterium]|nr:dihydroxyacetone kinase subunit DhaK [Phycisphaerae bacterium]